MNLIVITVDALRKETLKCYNEKEGVSIGFEDFYKRGSIFDRMFVTIPSTYGSLGSFFTGLHPFNHKIAIEPYDRSNLTFFDYLKDTHSLLLFTTEPPLGESLTYKEYEEYNLELEGTGRIDLRKSPIDVSRLLKYIEENKERDFFFTTHMWTPRKYKVYEENDFSKLIREKRYPEVWNGSLKLVEEIGVAINKIYLQLEKLDLLKNTIVIIAADHGDYFVSEYPTPGFHPPRLNMTSGCSHATHYNLAVNIPFILYHPELKPKRFPQIISTLDVFPTLLSFLNKPLKNKVDGINRENFLRGKEEFVPRDVFIDRLPTEPIYSIIDSEGWKLIFYLTRGFQLFNIFEDPEEAKDLAEERFDIVEKLLKKLYNYPISQVIKKENIMFRYLNYWNIDFVKKMFDQFDIDDWKRKAPLFEKVKWVTDDSLLNSVISEIPKEKNLKILEIGIGTGVLSKAIKKLYPSFSIIGIDLSPSMLSYIKKEDNIIVRTGDAHRLAFMGETFDVVIMRGVLPYLKDASQVFKEAFRVLRNGGIFILCEEMVQKEEFFKSWKKIMVDDLYYKSNAYKREEIENLFSEAQFLIVDKKAITLKNYSFNNYLLTYNEHESYSMKRRYYDAPKEYKNYINLNAEDIRSGQPYGDIFVDINFSIFKAKKGDQ